MEGVRQPTVATKPGPSLPGVVLKEMAPDAVAKLQDGAVLQDSVVKVTNAVAKDLLMIVTGLLQPTKGTTESVTTPGGTILTPGSVVNARVGKVGEGGRGVFQLSDGSRLTFMGARGLSVGEQVRLQVVTTVPETAMRVVASESQTAAGLAWVAGGPPQWT